MAHRTRQPTTGRATGRFADQLQAAAAANAPILGSQSKHPPVSLKAGQALSSTRRVGVEESRVHKPHGHANRDRHELPDKKVFGDVKRLRKPFTPPPTSPLLPLDGGEDAFRVPGYGGYVPGQPFVPNESLGYGRRTKALMRKRGPPPCGPNPLPADRDSDLPPPGARYRIPGTTHFSEGLRGTHARSYGNVTREVLAKRDTLTRGTKPDTTKSKWVGRLRKPTEKMLWSRALEDGVLDADEKRALVTSYVLRNARHLPLLGLGDAKGPEAAIDGILEKADEAAGRDSDNFTRHMGGLYSLENNVLLSSSANLTGVLNDRDNPPPARESAYVLATKAAAKEDDLVGRVRPGQGAPGPAAPRFSFAIERAVEAPSPLKRASAPRIPGDSTYLPGEKFAFAQTFGDLSSPLRLHHGVPATARAAAHDLPMQAKKRNLYEPTVYARSGGGGPCTSQSFSSWQSAELLHHKEWGDYKRGL